MSTQAEQDDRKVLQALNVAMQKARELDYELEKMAVTLSRTKQTCTAYFHPIPEPGHAVLGGDLTVVVDLGRMECIRVERGQ